MFIYMLTLWSKADFKISDHIFEPALKFLQALTGRDNFFYARLFVNAAVVVSVGNDLWSDTGVWLVLNLFIDFYLFWIFNRIVTGVKDFVESENWQMGESVSVTPEAFKHLLTIVIMRGWFFLTGIPSVAYALFTWDQPIVQLPIVLCLFGLYFATIIRPPTKTIWSKAWDKVRDIQFLPDPEPRLLPLPL